MEISRLAVIGAGEMGHGIAELAAVNEFEVVIQDIESDRLADAMEKIEWSLSNLEEKGEITEEIDTVLDRISTTTELDTAVGDVDVVVEAVPEDIELKHQVFSEIDATVGDETLLATNTSGIPITEIASATSNPERVIGMHFFNPVMLMDLIEIIRGEETSDKTARQAEDLADALGKQHVVLRKDVPGFITSRIISTYVVEGPWQLHEGAATMEEIDAACKYSVGFPMGPFELADQTGLDVPVKGVDSGSFDHVSIAPNHRSKVEAGKNGKKSGEGWYVWDDGSGCTASRDQADAFDALPVIAPSINEAARLVEWDAADPPEIDQAMRLGTAYPKGPCRLGDELGLHRVLESIESNARYEPADHLVEMVESGRTGAEAGEGFYEHGSDNSTYHTIDLSHDEESGIATITLDRPSRQNSLNLELLGELEDVVDQIQGSESVRCIVIRGAGGNFCAGGDVSMFSDLEPYDSLSLPDVQTRVEQLGVPTVAAIEGNCLGGGLELAAACDFRLAKDTATLGTTEITLGLIPGGGGTQRLPRLIGLAKAKELVLLGETLTAEEANKIDLVTTVYPPEDFEAGVNEFATQLSGGPPIAQHAAKVALHRGVDAPLPSGLTVEQAVFGLLFNTEDVDEGIDAFYDDRSPEFSGE